MPRVVSWFSCGAASAYATYLAHQKYGDDMIAVYCRVAEEHPDNLRFLEEFQEKTGIGVQIIGSEKHDYSIFNVFRERKFIKGPTGAPCTMVLKKWQRKTFQQPDDIQIFGYTVEEQSRADRFIDSNNEVDADFILLDRGISKQDCKDFVQSLGIKLQIMYRLGYGNANCVGCVKGGLGYWSKGIKQDFPAIYERMAKLERELGHAINKDKNGPVFLDEITEPRGNFKRDMPGDCGFTCEWKDDADA